MYLLMSIYGENVDGTIDTDHPRQKEALFRKNQYYFKNGNIYRKEK